MNITKKSKLMLFASAFSIGLLSLAPVYAGGSNSDGHHGDKKHGKGMMHGHKMAFGEPGKESASLSRMSANSCTSSISARPPCMQPIRMK
jgi:hypothetical protein